MKYETKIYKYKIKICKYETNGGMPNKHFWHKYSKRLCRLNCFTNAL